MREASKTRGGDKRPGNEELPVANREHGFALWARIKASSDIMARRNSAGCIVASRMGRSDACTNRAMWNGARRYHNVARGNAPQCQ